MHINFAARSAENVLAALRPMQAVCVAVGLLLSASGAWLLNDVAPPAELARRPLQTSLPPVKAAQPVSISEAQAHAVNAVVQQLNLPWDALLLAIERATPSQVAVLELEPDAKSHRIRIAAETSTPEQMLSYIEQLKQQDFLRHVSLGKHELNTAEANGTLRFELQADWQERAP